MSQSQPQLTLFVDFYIQPQLIEKWKAAHRHVWAACANEPKCLLVDVFEDSRDRGHFTLIEVWDATKQWFLEEQMTKSYYDELWQKTEFTYRKARNIRFAERLGEGGSYRPGYLEGATCMD